MKSLRVLTTIYFVLTFAVCVSYCLEEYTGANAPTLSESRLVRVKRKGGRGGGGRSSGRGSKGKSGSNPYPKQPPYNPSYTPGNSYPKQPGQTGMHNPGQAGGHYPGQTGGGYQQPNYGQAGGHAYGTGMMGSGGKSKSGIGALGAGALGGIGGAALGAYGGYKLGKMVGGMGYGGHYGYFDNHGGQQIYVRCDPPPRIETDPTTNITYIPKTVTYDARCSYYDQDHSRRYPTRQYGYYAGASSQPMPSYLTTILTVLLVMVFGFNNGIPLRFGSKLHKT